MGSDSSGRGPDRYPVDAEEDLMDRYESMVQTQVDTISDIDDKAARTLRIITILLGALFTAVSISVQYFQTSNESLSIFQIALFGTGFLFLLASTGYASITYLSSVFKYGPTEDLGAAMAQYEISPQDYRNNLLDAYSTIIEKNREVVQTNSRRFRRTMLFLLLGLIFLFIGGVSATLSLDVGGNALLTFFSAIGAIALVYFIDEEEYLTLEWQSDGDD